MPSSEPSNTTSTGGGGFTFERNVGALYLASLVTDFLPPGAIAGRVKRVHFQARAAGALFDDIVADIENFGLESRLAVQVKLTINPTRNDDDFNGMIHDAWEMYRGGTSFKFDPTRDKLLIVTGPPTQKVMDIRHLSGIADQASTLKTFKSNVESQSNLGKGKREIFEIIRQMISDAKGSPVTDEEIWGLLKCLRVEYVDVGIEGKDRHLCITQLSDISGNDPDKAKTIFEMLSAKVGECAPYGGDYTAERLHSELKNVIVERKQSDVREPPFSEAERTLNDVVYKPLTRTKISKNSPYSIALVDDQGTQITSLKYFKFAEKFLEKYPQIYQNLQDAKSIEVEYNKLAESTVQAIEECVKLKMQISYAHIRPEENYHATKHNSYSLPSLRFLVWDYIIRDEHSIIKELASKVFTEFPANENWIISQPSGGGFVTSANNIVNCELANHPTIDEIIRLVTEIGNEATKRQMFLILNERFEALERHVSIFTTNLIDLSERIDLGLPEKF